jgi:hypothetical protein
MGLLQNRVLVMAKTLNWPQRKLLLHYVMVYIEYKHYRSSNGISATRTQLSEASNFSEYI